MRRWTEPPTSSASPSAPARSSPRARICADAASITARSIALLCEAERCLIVLQADELLTLLASTAPPTAPGLLEVEVAAAAAALRTGDPRHVEQTVSDGAVSSTTETVATLALPLRRGGEVVAVAVCSWPEPRGADRRRRAAGVRRRLRGRRARARSPRARRPAREPRRDRPADRCTHTARARVDARRAQRARRAARADPRRPRRRRSPAGRALPRRARGAARPRVP